MNNTVKTVDAENNDDTFVPMKKDTRFWVIILGLSITALLAALDGTILTTALPSITAALQGGEKFVWVSGAYFLTR
jgi:hypothetical protein